MWGYWLEVATTVGIQTIMALGIYITLLTGQLSIGGAAIAGVGGYISGLLLRDLGAPFVLSLVAGAVASAVLAGVFSFLAVRLQYMYMAVTTLGFGEFMVSVANASDWIGGPLGLQGVPAKTTPLLVLALLALVLLLLYLLETSRLGLAFRAVRDDEIAATSLGIDVRLVRVLSFTLGALVTGLGGALYSSYFTVIQPSNLNFMHSLSLLIFVVLGGVDSMWGSLLGAGLLMLLAEVLRFSLYDRYLYYGALVVIVVVLRPRGLLLRRAYQGLDV